MSTESTFKQRMKSVSLILACGTALFSDGYGNGVIGSVNTLIKRSYPGQVPANYSTTLSSVVFVGNVLGMLVFGYFSDKIGRKTGMMVAAGLVAFFSALSAASSGAHGSVRGLISMLIVCRFFLGIGIGAEYPTGSVSASEQTEGKHIAKNAQHRWFALATNCAIDTAFCVAAFVPLVMFWIFGNKHLRAAWRLSLGLGFFPAAAVFVWRWSMEEPDLYKKNSMKRVTVPYKLVLKRYGMQLAAISLTWFIYDFITYPFGIYSSPIVDTITGGDSSLTTVFGWNVVINLFYMPGTIIGAFVVDYLGPKWTMITGLLFQALIGFIMSGAYTQLTTHIAGFAVVYGIFLSFGEFGPGNNLGLLASKSSPTAIRGQFYGVAAAIGKLGAFVGTWAFPAMTTAFSKRGVYAGATGPFWVGSGLAIFSALITYFFIKPLDHDGMNAEEVAFREYLEANGFDTSLMGNGEEPLETDSVPAIDEKEEKVPRCGPESLHVTFSILFMRRHHALIIISLFTTSYSFFYFLSRTRHELVVKSPSAAPKGWHIFEPPTSLIARPSVAERTLSQTLPCIDSWVAHGMQCNHTTEENAGVDILWTWVNSSEPLLAATRQRSVETGLAKHRDGPVYGSKKGDFLGARESHFRSHGELRHSMRSVLTSLDRGSVRNLHLLTADIPSDIAGLRLGSTPDWLDLSAGVRVVHHSEVFRVPESSLGIWGKERMARAWRDEHVPSFNSLAIESQFGNMPNLGKTLFYLNDDCFLLKPISLADFETALYGPVFRIHFGLKVESHDPSKRWKGGDKEGEWPALEYNQRFGARPRRYLHHIGKTVSVPVMREVGAIWADELAKTAQSRFRGHGLQVNMLYLTTWYNIEKHRESLLFSLIILRADANRDGAFSRLEWSNFVATLQPNGLVPVRSRRNISLTPRETSYDWLSSDGYPLLPSGTCTIDIAQCFPPSLSPLEIFQRIAFEIPTCGDCVIATMVDVRKLEAFLPPNSVGDGLSTFSPIMAKSWQHLRPPKDVGRAFAVENIHRYSYALGTSPFEFISISNHKDVNKLPLQNSSTAFLAVNDDVVAPFYLEQVDQRMQAWFAARWGAVRGWWEKAGV
ncbi:unnamed protein product [Mycena citricolor]|uniref:Major facilitator superfamily (MFS) profile domain-containing protein n=1 Tax=Mycena citricolor TaxID=2018698 RepID=A0AAD2HJ78_9AGAR|nr:unnamed protein product [Mycena citricolor]